MYLSILDIIRSFGPTPLDELTSRVSNEPEQVAEEINGLIAQGLLEVLDERQNPVKTVTVEQTLSFSGLVQLSRKSIRMAFAS